jgi:hydrogenase-4 component F
MIEWLILFPFLTGILCAIFSNRRIIEIISTIGAVLTFGYIVVIVNDVLLHGPVTVGLWFIDELSAYFVFIIGLIGMLAAIYSIAYIGHDYNHQEINQTQFRLYYILFHLFISSMILVCITNNLGITWVAIEATTLASALLVGIYSKKTSIEAAWKYLIICTVGIGIAFFGVILYYTAAELILNDRELALNWNIVLENAGSLNPVLIKYGFLFILIGYGTKFGLVPMHTWLPDAHSQAPTPISALLSGVLLNCAVYGIIRYLIIMSHAIGLEYPAKFLLVFGLISVLVAMFYVIAAKDYKRLLAFSTIEHMGIIAIGLGIGNPIGIFGALYHVFNHSMSKSMLFLGTGNILQKYQTRKIEQVKYIGSVMPVTAVFLIIGMFALTGAPPFSIFMSEITILNSMIISQQYLVAILFMLGIVSVFAGFLRHFTAMIFGKTTQQSSTFTLPIDTINGEFKELELSRGELSYVNLIVMGCLIAIVLIVGIAPPTFFINWINQIIALF